jgi:hypothetical protein
VTIQPKFGSTGLTLDGHGHEVGSKCLHIYWRTRVPSLHGPEREDERELD